MSKLSKWLVSLCAVFSLTAFADDGEFSAWDDLTITHNASGFVQYIGFSDSAYHKDINVAQVNYTSHIGTNLVFRAQARTDFGVSGLLLEHSKLDVKDNSEDTFQIGRYARASGFYNDVTDNAFSSNMTVLPTGTYMIRGDTSKLTFADGVRYKKTYFEPGYSLSIAGAVGTSVINSMTRDETQLYIFGFKKPDMGLQAGAGGAKDFTVKYESADWDAYASVNTFRYKTDVTNAVTDTVGYRTGIRHRYGPRLTDFQWIMLDAKTDADTPIGRMTFKDLYKGISISHTRFLDDDWALTGTYSHGTTRLTNPSNKERFHEWVANVSKSLPQENIIMTLSYHMYRGDFRTSLYAPPQDHSVFGFSITKAF